MPSILASLPVFQGSKPEVPAYNPVDPYSEQLATIQGNLAAVPGEAQLAQRTNLANLQGTQDLIRRAIPGFAEMQRLSENALQSYLRGEIPSDLQSNISQGANARAFAGGYGGSGMGRNLTARDLGRTSLDLQQYGIGASQAYARNNPALAMTPRYAVGNSFLSPTFTIPLREQQAQQTFNRDWLASQLAAAPAPWAAHLGSALDSVADTAMSMAASYGGGMLGGGGGQRPPSYSPMFNYNTGYGVG